MGPVCQRNIITDGLYLFVTTMVLWYLDNIMTLALLYAYAV